MDDITQYIYIDGSNKPSRGRFELAFSQIGGSILVGAGIGGLIGGFNGIKSIGQTSETKLVASYTAKRSKMLNYISKTSAVTASSFGVISLLYSAIDVGLSFFSENTDYNTIAAATLTGIIYRGASEIKPVTDSKLIRNASIWSTRLGRSFLGGMVGLTASTIFVLTVNRNSKSKLLNHG